MGAAPSRETHRRGLFSVSQITNTTGSNANNNNNNNNNNAVGTGKRQELVLVPLTKEYFPSPDCPLFVQFHRARCDAAVNYYFRHPGDPGDMSAIPNYAGAYRMSEERVRHLRRRAERRRRRREQKNLHKQQQQQEEGGENEGEEEEKGNGTGNGKSKAGDDTAAMSPSDADGGADAHPHSGAATAAASSTTVAEEKKKKVEGASNGDSKHNNDNRHEDKGKNTTADENDNIDDDDDGSDSDGDGGDPLGDPYPSREALYRGIIDHVEEILFDTDAEMRHAYADACAHPEGAAASGGRKTRKVLPVLCAVAFRQISAAPPPPPSFPAAAAAPPPPPPPTSSEQVIVEQGVYVHGSVLNIVGCFGFVSMQEEVDAILQLQQQQQQQAYFQAGEGSSAGAGGIISPPVAFGGGAMSSSFGSGVGPSASVTVGAVVGGGASSGSYHNPPFPLPTTTAMNANNLLQPQQQQQQQQLPVPLNGGGGPTANLAGPFPNNATLPAPVAAPLAALVFLTKSAGEQNLGRVTHIAATTYYHQLIQAGVIQSRTAVISADPMMQQQQPQQSVVVGGGGGGVPPRASPGMPPMPPMPPHLVGAGAGMPPAPFPHSNSSSPAMSSVSAPPRQYPRHGGGGATYPMTSPLASMPELFQPPMETFSFSSLLTNIPILSFLYEMKCRWGYLGVLRSGTPTANSSFASSSLPNFSLPFGRRPGSMMGHRSTGGLAAVDPRSGQDVTDEMEMWITPDHMIHGRISQDLASRLCLSLAERPEVMQERVLQLPSEDDGYWRYRGLVDQARPPPVPARGKLVSIHPRDVYVMGSDVLPGFDEGDILRFDPERLVWYADHSIPLEGVVLAAMRAYCKCAREAAPTDPNWVTRLAPAEELEYLVESGAELFPTPPPTEEQLAQMAADPSLRLLHEHVGSFYVYRFERDGTVYHHGTIPNFANPNKRRNNNNNAHGGNAAAAANNSNNHNNIASLAAGGGGGGGEATKAAAAAAAAVSSAAAAAAAAAPPSHGNGSNNNTVTATATTTTAAAAAAANAAAAAAAATTSSPSPTTANTTSGGIGAEKPSVPVARTLIGALFSLYPPATATAATTTPAAAVDGDGSGRPPPLSGFSPTAAAAGSGGGGGGAPSPGVGPHQQQQHQPGRGFASPSPSAATPAAAVGPSPSPPVTTPPAPVETPAYLRGRVTSTAIEAARTLMKNLYSYAYGTPAQAPARPTMAPSPVASTSVRSPVAVAANHHHNHHHQQPHHAHQGLDASGGGQWQFVTARPAAAGCAAPPHGPTSHHRAGSTVSRGSLHSTPAARYVNPNAQVNATAATNNATTERDAVGSPPLTPLQPIHVRVSSRGSGRQFSYPVHAAQYGGPAVPPSPSAPGGGGGGEGSTSVPPQALHHSSGGSMRRSGSYAEFSSSASPVQQLQQQPVKRYTDSGTYVWDWRMSSTQ